MPHPMTALLPLAMLWTPYADWIYTAVSISGLVMMVMMVLRPRN